ncbi:MAG: acyl-CoA synthetase [Burkholderiaceae bacterium]
MTDTPRPDDILSRQAKTDPQGIAYRMLESGQAVTWSELEQRSRRCAAFLIARGLRTGDGIAVFLDNHPRYFEILWAAHRIGLYYTTVSRHLKAAEVLYIVNDCGAKVLFTSTSLLAAADDLAKGTEHLNRISLDGTAPGFEDYETALQAIPTNVTLPDTPEGTDFSYSSGTTGLPKGIKRDLACANKHFVAEPSERTRWKDFDRNTVYLSTAPFYHTAPVRWNMNVMRQGGSCVLMEKFDAQAALAAIERFRITHSQWVPTMFIRLLRLPDDQRLAHDLSSLRFAIHAAAPCPAWVKQAMIDWWGPILYEYYSGTELVGRTSLNSAEWLSHQGSVGRAEFGAVHILDEDGQPQPAGTPGVIWFSGGPTFQYHGDPQKTRQAFNAQGWASYGDIGYLDDEGYLYLTDRLANMIVSGGVNIYPQETENVLTQHPCVHDVAVVGVPNEEFGEEVKAVIQLRHGIHGTPELADELIAWCRDRLSTLKCPRSVDFVENLPRTETGKLLKREVKRAYWPQSGQSLTATSKAI